MTLCSDRYPQSGHHLQDQYSYRCPIVKCASTFVTAQELRKHSSSCLFIKSGDKPFITFVDPEESLEIDETIGCVVTVVALLFCLPLRILYRNKRQRKREQEQRDREVSADNIASFLGSTKETRLEQRQCTPRHSPKPSVAISEVEGSPVEQQQPQNRVRAELDESASRSELESPISASPQRSPRLGNKPTYIELPSPTYSRQISASASRSSKLDVEPSRFGHLSPEEATCIFQPQSLL